MTNLEIEAFLAVVRLGSITAAAQAIFITQPALSRRLQTLEEELGYPLFRRRKGQRNIQLTEEGKAFVPVAERWRQLWRQSREIAGLSHRGKMTVAVIGSINTYLMPPVYRCFLRRFPGSSLAVTDQRSVAVYDLVASGQADLGLISDDRYVKQVDTVPLFKEKMVLVSGEDTVFPEDLRPDQLDPSRELRLPWNPEYNRWHDYWFGGAQPHVYFDQMALLEDFIRDSDCWVLLPASIAGALLNRGGLRQFPLQQAPPDRIIYSVLGQKEENMLAGSFMTILKEILAQNPWLELL